MYKTAEFVLKQKQKFVEILHIYLLVTTKQNKNMDEECEMDHWKFLTEDKSRKFPMRY